MIEYSDNVDDCVKSTIWKTNYLVYLTYGRLSIYYFPFGFQGN